MIKALLIIMISSMAHAQKMHWFDDFIEIKRQLMDGRMVRIPNAFTQEVIDKYIDFENCKWEEELGVADNEKREWFKRHKDRDCANPFSEYLMKHKQYFENFLPTKTISEVKLTATDYRTDDYLELHNDYGNKRVLTFILHMSNAKPDCGGKLIWAGEYGIKKALPRINTLYLFIPTSQSYHSIETVRCGSRKAITGWFIDGQYD